MLRTQIYITPEERSDLNHLTEETGKTQSQIIREAIDYYIAAHQIKMKDKRQALQAAKGLWANRDDLPHFAKLRTELDRDSEEK